MAREGARIELVPSSFDRGAPGDGRTKSERPHYVQVVAGNGSVLAASLKPYSTKGNARRAAVALAQAFREILRVESAGVTWPPQPIKIKEVD